MKKIDYMKVIDIISNLFKAERNVDLSAKHEKIDIFDITMKCHNGSEVSYRIHLPDYEMEIIFAKKYFDTIKFDKWISKFEYKMEQTFLRNIKIEVHEETHDYRIKVLT